MNNKSACAKCGNDIDKTAMTTTWSILTIYPAGQKKRRIYLCEHCTPVIVKSECENKDISHVFIGAD